jgi:hypothetical protein
MFALKSAICLKERHPNHPKTIPSLVVFFRQWLELSKDKAAFIEKRLGGDERLWSVVEHEIKEVLKCPENLDDSAFCKMIEEQAYEKNDGKHSALDFILQKNKLFRNGAGLQEDLVKALQASNRQVLRVKTLIAA